MTTYIAANMPTKKLFRECVKLGRNASMYENGNTYVTLRDLHDRIGYSFTVTNARRTWFASVTVLPERKLRVT